MSPNDYVELEVDVMAKTEQAIKVTDGFTIEWIPASQIQEDLEDIDHGIQEINVKLWIAREKHLI